MSQSSVAATLNTDTLKKLVSGSLAAIHVRDFYPAEVAQRFVEKIIKHPELGHYHKKYTSSVGRVYMPHIDTRWDQQLIDKYHSAALPAIHDIRQLFYPYLSPVDHVRLLLSELWPGGANLLRLRKRPCFVGALRVFQPELSRFLAHNDRITQETDAPEIAGLLEQLVVNIYLQVPSEGGDLQLWHRYPTEEEGRVILEVEGLDPESVEKPRHTIHPNAGDLIIFSSAMLHAVTPGNGYRVGMAAFVACKGEDEPLLLWS